MKNTDPAWIKVKRVWLVDRNVMYPDEVQIFMDQIRVKFNFAPGEICIFPAIQVLSIDIEEEKDEKKQ